MRNGEIDFINYNRQLSPLFQIYDYFESILKRNESLNINNKVYNSYVEKYQKHISHSHAFKVMCIDNRFTKPVVVHQVKGAAYRFISVILKEHKYCRKITKKTLTKHLS